MVCEENADQRSDANGSAHEVCHKTFDANTRRDSERYGPLSEYRETGWHLLWAVPVFLVVPPLLVYGIIKVFVRIGSWVVGGFKQAATR
jgi:hypothetical protein